MTSSLFRHVHGLSTDKEMAAVGALQCPYHPDEALIEDHAAGDMICPQCGLVVGDRSVYSLIY